MSTLETQRTPVADVVRNQTSQTTTPTTFTPVMYAIAAIGFAVLIRQALLYYPFMADDAFISLRYSQRFIHGHGLTWTDGAPVEGYTNLLWVLLCAAVGALHIDLVFAARLLGIALSGATIMAIVYAFPAQRMADAGPAAAGVLAAALSPPIAVWAIGGLEQPVVIALFAWMLALFIRHTDQDQGPADAPTGDDARALRRTQTWLFILSGLLCTARADAFVLVFGIAVGGILVSFKDRQVRHLLRATIAGALSFSLVQLIFRLAYYHEFVPNTAIVKVAFTFDRVVNGFWYVGDGLHALWPLIYVLVLGGLMLIALKRRPQSTAIILSTGVIWTCYIGCIGGDIFPAYRQLLPTLICGMFVLSMCASASLTANRRSIRVALFSGCLIVALLGLNAAQDPAVQAAKTERWEWEGKSIALMLKSAFGTKNPLICFDCAGAVPYYSEFRSIDPLGLNDSHIARHRGPEFGHAIVGHELGDGKYVLDQKPDLVIFHEPAGSTPFFQSGLEMVRDPRWALYQSVMFHVNQPVPMNTHVWIRREDGSLGIRRSAREVIVPGYFVTGVKGNLAEVEPGAGTDARLLPGTPNMAPGIPLGPGKWLLSIETGPDGVSPKIKIDLGLDGSSYVRRLTAGEIGNAMPIEGYLIPKTKSAPAATSENSHVTIRLATNRDVDVIVRNLGDRPVYIRRLVFQKVGD